MTGTARENAAARGGEPAGGPGRLARSGLSNEIQFLAARARSLGTDRANSRLAALDLKVRSYSVLALACVPGGLSQRDLAQYLCLDPSQIVALVDGLEQRGLVERLADPGDRRSKVIYATDAGKKLYGSAADTVRGAEEASLRNLTDGERDRLRGLLRKIAFTPAD